MTIAEVSLIVNAYNEKVKNDFKSQIAMNYDLAQNIALAVNARLNGNNPPSLYETYPELFKEELEQQEQEKIEKDLQFYKEQFIEFANSHNKKREGETIDD